MSKPDQSQLNLTVQSQTNAGSAGGTMYYINLGGIKILWGTTATLSNSAAGPNFGVTFPSGFFSTIQSATASLNTLTATAQQSVNWNGITATAGQLTAYAAATAGSENIAYMVIGT